MKVRRHVGTDDPVTSNLNRLRGLSEETEIKSERVPLVNIEVLGIVKISREACDVDGRIIHD